MAKYAVQAPPRIIPSAAGDIPGCDVVLERPEAEDAFQGLWRSEYGSLYVFNADALVCVCVHSSRFVGWINKVAVADIRGGCGHYSGMQAFRNPRTGVLCSWEPVTLTLNTQTLDKYFPCHIPAQRLVYGYHERYYRVEEP